MSFPPHRTRQYRIKNTRVEIVPSSLGTDLITAFLVVAWMGWTYGAMDTFGLTPWIIAASVVIGVTGVLAIHGQYVTYFQLGSWIVVGRKPPGDEDEQPARRERRP